MKRILLVLALICIIASPVFSQTGSYTTNEYFYLPEYGSYGTDEYDEYNAYMEIADNQIESNKDGLALRYLKTEMDSFSELQAIISDKTLVNVEDGITATAIQDDLILKADFADEDWGDMSVSTNVVTLDAEVVDSDQYVDGSIDHEHLAPDVISGLADVTSTDSDYILIWDATDSALKKCDMGEVRGAGGLANIVEDTTPQLGGHLDTNDFSISFPATQAPDAGANVLDDYEEGEWNPGYAPATGDDFASVTYDFQRASYTKVGRIVHINCRMRTDAIDKGTATGSAVMLLTGLPFTIKNDLEVTFNHPVGLGAFFAGDSAVALFPNTNTTTLTIRKNLSGDSLDVDDMGTGANANLIGFQLSYIAE